MSLQLLFLGLLVIVGPCLGQSWRWNGVCQGIPLTSRQYCTTIEECRTRCRDNSGCFYFSYTYSGQQCQLFKTCPYTDMTMTAFSQPKWGSSPWPFCGSSDCFLCAACPKGDKYNQADIHSDSYYSCAQKCDNDPNCKMWTFRTQQRLCDLYDHRCSLDYNVQFPKSGYKGCTKKCQPCCQPNRCQCCQWNNAFIQRDGPDRDPKLPKKASQLKDPPPVVVKEVEEGRLLEERKEYSEEGPEGTSGMDDRDEEYYYSRYHSRTYEDDSRRDTYNDDSFEDRNSYRTWDRNSDETNHIF